jgi:hypothetical protein
VRAMASAWPRAATVSCAPPPRAPRPSERPVARHHFAHAWLDRGGAEGDLMELSGWSSPQMLRRYGASARGARARRGYDPHHEQLARPGPGPLPSAAMPP